jgi:hypothetical protein
VTTVAEVFRNAADIVAHLEGMTAAVVEVGAAPVLRRARAILAEHATGDDDPHEVVLRLGTQTDAFVDLIGPAPAAVEKGRVTQDGKVVEGLHILKRAIGE